MKKLLFLLLSLPCLAQAQTNNVFTSTVNTETWGKPANVMVYLPSDYKTKTYPVFWFWNGMGEDQGDVSKLAVWGPFSFIGPNWQPPFIALAVQGMEWPDQAHTDSIYMRLKSTYNLGPVVASGLSAGGYGVTKLMSYYPGSIFSKAVVAIIPMSTSEGFGATAVAPTVASKIPVWAFGDEKNDVHGVNTYNFYLALKKANPTGNYKWTSMYPRGHGGWNDFYTPAYKENGLNIYDWGMQFVKPTVPPVLPPLPIARIILDSSVINSPNSIVRVNADSSVRAVSTQWVQYSGPSAAIWTPIAGTPHKSDMLISGLFPGTYVFGLYVNDTLARLDSTKVIVTVKPAVCPTCPPPVICPVCPVCPPPPAPRTVTGVTVTFINGQPVLKFSYSDGNP